MPPTGPEWREGRKVRRPARFDDCEAQRGPARRYKLYRLRAAAAARLIMRRLETRL